MPREGTETRLKRLADSSLLDKNLEIRCPERGRKQKIFLFLYLPSKNLEIRCPERGRKLLLQSHKLLFLSHLEIRCPERGRKLE